MLSDLYGKATLKTGKMICLATWYAGVFGFENNYTCIYIGR